MSSAGYRYPIAFPPIFRGSILEPEVLLLPKLPDLDTDTDPDLLFELEFLPAIQKTNQNSKTKNWKNWKFGTHVTI